MIVTINLRDFPYFIETSFKDFLYGNVSKIPVKSTLKIFETLFVEDFDVLAFAWHSLDPVCFYFTDFFSIKSLFFLCITYCVSLSYPLGCIPLLVCTCWCHPLPGAEEAQPASVIPV